MAFRRFVAGVAAEGQGCYAQLMRIYFDMCSLMRPFDDQTQLRNRLEAEAIRLALALCQAGQATFIASFALALENKHNSAADRQAFAANLLAGTALQVGRSPETEREAQTLASSGIKMMDALHLACAIAADAHYFCTCDDRFLKRARTAKTANTKVVNPLELVTELGL